MPDVNSLPDDANGRLIRLGRELTVATYAVIGPTVADPAKRMSGNGLACQSCHLDAGTRQFGLPFVGVFGDFPQYRAREGRVGSLADRVNGCMTRSMNGVALPAGSLEMRAFLAYIQFLSTGPQQDGRGAGKLPEMTRAADPGRGEIVFRQICAACHGVDGQGKLRGEGGQSYEFPPLWGPNSFNDGAGMNRLTASASFIHSNMPNGVTWQAPSLPVEDAWDVAAFMISRDRPHKADLDQDFPNRLEKPVDAAYPPFADGFDSLNHRFGPFEPIRQKIKELKAQPEMSGPSKAN